MYTYTIYNTSCSAIPCFCSPCYSPLTSLCSPLLTWKPSFGVMRPCPPWSQVARKLTSPFSFPPHSKFPTPRVNCALYWDDIVIPASLGPEQVIPRNGRIRNGHSRIGRSRNGTSTICTLITQGEKEIPKKNPGSYLQCLDGHNLKPHARWLATHLKEKNL
jgi:hypothetical protein